jgi:tetratricopeptide (TPR) repeat protein
MKRRAGKDPRGLTKRTLVSAALVIAAALISVGCGGNGQQGDAAAAATEGPGEAGSASTSAPVEDADRIEEHLAAAADHFADGDYDEAVAELEAAVELEPENLDAYSNLALAHFRNGAYEEAASAWTVVIDAEHDTAGRDTAAILLDRGQCYFNLKRYDEAISDLTAAAQQDSGNVDAYRIRGKSYAFLEEYELAIADFTRTIELDPGADEAYLNRAISTGKIGSVDDLPSIIADCGMVMQVSEDDGIRQEAQTMLENIVQKSSDPVIRQQASDALQGKVAALDDAEADPDPSGVDTGADQAPGHSIAFEGALEPDEAQRFLFLASPGDTIGASVSATSDFLVGIEHAETGTILSAVRSGDDSLLVTIPENGLYHVVIEDAGGLGGPYTAAFEASPRVSFALEPSFFIVGRLPEGGLLYYTYTARAGAALRGSVVPHPDTPVDPVVTIRELESQEAVQAFDEASAGENESFTFTVPESAGARLMTYIVTVEDAERRAGAYTLTVDSEEPDVGDQASGAPESVVQTLFDAAKSGDFAALAALCDPLGENDSDTQMICDLATDDANREMFVEYFATGTIAGDAQVSPQGDRAIVSFLYGPNGDREAEMKLINRDGTWYLLGF